MGFLFEETALSSEHRKMLKELMHLEIKLAHEFYDAMKLTVGNMPGPISSMELSTYMGFHFGIYCLLQASSILESKLSRKEFILERNALIRIFVKQHRNICNLKTVEDILEGATLSNWRQNMESNNDFIRPTSYFNQADEVIKRYYNGI